ncbi:MAG: hypothetical protein ACKPKO_61615, partial [Candidatus Fonsibacter sp.]
WHPQPHKTPKLMLPLLPTKHTAKDWATTTKHPDPDSDTAKGWVWAPLPRSSRSIAPRNPIPIKGMTARSAVAL